MCIEDGVGAKQRNRPTDVVVIKTLLNFWLTKSGRGALAIDRQVDVMLLNALELFLVEHGLNEAGRLQSPLAATRGLLSGERGRPLPLASTPGAPTRPPVVSAKSSAGPCVLPTGDTGKSTERYSAALRALRGYLPPVGSPADLTGEHVQLVIAEAKRVNIDRILPHLIAALTSYEINTPVRIAQFLPQMGVETKYLASLREEGSDAYLARYEPGERAGDIVGNTEAGDGKTFKGRGLLHLTGRENYTKYSKYRKKNGVGTDITSDYTRADVVAIDLAMAADSAGWYWTRGRRYNVNEIADKGDVAKVTYEINGGKNGLAERQALFRRASFAILGA